MNVRTYKDPQAIGTAAAALFSAKVIENPHAVLGLATGSQALYDWLDENPGVIALPIAYVNDPAVIASMDNFVSLNSCVSVDLYGQINSESAGLRHISGTGGQVDFLTGATKSRGGKAFICASSTFKAKDGSFVIGCGNAGMDAAAGAYAMGAESVTCIDVQKPAAFAHEIAHIEALGGKLLWPVMTKEITDGGLITADGTLISGDMVIITIGESPDLGYLPEGVRKFRDWVIPGADMSLLENVFAAGDVIKPGLLADAIGTGIKAAEAVDASLRGVAYAPVEKKPVPSGQLSTAYFTRCPHGELPAANRDFDRCVSCGTCRDCRMCLESCPEGAISRETLAGGAYRYVSDPDRCIGCGICSGVCPCGIWTMHPNVPLE